MDPDKLFSWKTIVCYNFNKRMVEGRRSTDEQGKLVSRYQTLRGQRGIEANVRNKVNACPPLVSDE
eukprot:6472228-Amphidinium_carterae.1